MWWLLLSLVGLYFRIEILLGVEPSLSWVVLDKIAKAKKNLKKHLALADKNEVSISIVVNTGVNVTGSYFLSLMSRRQEKKIQISSVA